MKKLMICCVLFGGLAVAGFTCNYLYQQVNWKVEQSSSLVNEVSTVWIRTARECDRLGDGPDSDRLLQEAKVEVESIYKKYNKPFRGK